MVSLGLWQETAGARMEYGRGALHEGLCKGLRARVRGSATAGSSYPLKLAEQGRDKGVPGAGSHFGALVGDGFVVVNIWGTQWAERDQSNLGASRKQLGCKP